MLLTLLISLPVVGHADAAFNIRIINDQAPDCSTLASIVESVTRDCVTDDERGIALYNYCKYSYYHHAYPNEPGGIGALKHINVYGWSLCGGEHTVLAALAEQLGWEWRFRGWSNPGHTTVELKYGGRWHYLDTFLKFYAWMHDEETDTWAIAGQDDIIADPTLVTEGLVLDPARRVYYHRDAEYDWLDANTINWRVPAFLVCGDPPSGVITGVNSSRLAGSPRGWNALRFDEPEYSTNVDLGVGYSLTLNWDRVEGGKFPRDVDPEPKHSCGDKDYRNCAAIGPLLEPYREPRAFRSWSNGELRFAPDLSDDAWTDSVDATTPGTKIVAMSIPYRCVKATGRIESAEPATVEVSADGENWHEVTPGEDWDSIAGGYSYQVRITHAAPLTALELTSVVMHNERALPYLAPGRNEITISTDGALPAGSRLAVTYAYQPGSRDRDFGEMFDRDCEIARGHHASWQDEPAVVQTVLDELPAELTIDIPTARGKQPVYPRMLYLRREILGPGQEPMPVPTEPTVPKHKKSALQTLPSPWTVGSNPPIPRPARPTKTVTLPISTRYVASMGGEVHEHHFVKWLKDSSDAWVWLLGLPDGLPKAEDVASARLTFAVWECHDKADMEVAATILAAPAVPGEVYDFAQIGLPIGSTTVKRSTTAEAFDPAIPYEIDITRGLRRMLRTGEGAGFGIRIVPNRAVDDGWTVRFTPDEGTEPQLVIDVYDG